MRAVVYVRCSLDRTGEEASVSRQREDCHALVVQRGWTLAQTLVDNDTSAAGKVTRPGFETLLSGLDAGHWDAVAAWNIDRLTRNRRDTLRLIETGQRRSTVIAVVRGSDYDLSTPAGRMTADILASVARNEIEVKSDRQRRARQQAAAAGHPARFAHRPFGYRNDKTTPEPDEAAAVVAGCNLLLSGASLCAVTRAWNDAGLRTPQRGKGFTTQGVRAVLRNPRIAGLAAYNGEVVAAGNWTPLVAEDTWRAVRALLDDPTRAPQTRGVRSLLGGMARCPSGCRVFSTRSTRGAAAYRCRDKVLTSQPRRGGEHVCRAAGPVDEYVTAIVCERLSRPDAAELLVDHDRPDVDALRGQARALRGRLEELGAEFASGELPAAQLRVINERIAAQLRDIEAQIADAGRVSVLGVLVGTQDVRAVWDGLDVDRRRAVIDTLMTVTLLSPGRGVRGFDPDTIRIEPKL